MMHGQKRLPAADKSAPANYKTNSIRDILISFRKNLKAGGRGCLIFFRNHTSTKCAIKNLKLTRMEIKPKKFLVQQEIIPA